MSRFTFLILGLTSLWGSAAFAQPAEPPPTPPTEPTPPVEPVPPVTPEPPPVVVVAPEPPKPAKPDKPDKPDKPAKPKLLDLKPGGYVHVDGRRFLTDTGAHEIAIRRLRFKLDGTAGPHFKFRTLIDFAGSKLVVDDAWGEIDLRPEIGIRFGKDKAQFGIERLQSAATLVFVERAFPTQISPNRDIGVWARGDLAGGFVHYAAGVVDGVANNAVIEGETDNRVEYNAHVLVSPLAKDKKLGDLGIGGATTFGRTNGTLLAPGLTNIKSAGQTTIVKYAVGDTADVTARADGYRARAAAHAYYYGGPVGVLAEYVRDQESVVLGGKHTLVQNQAWQLATSVAVTPGDHPTYKSVKPHRVFDPENGTWGAVEIAARYSELRIDSDAFTAKILSATSSVERAREITLGVNWYFNEAVKLQLDYSLTSFKGGAADGADRKNEHLLATRLQVSI